MPIRDCHSPSPRSSFISRPPPHQIVAASMQKVTSLSGINLIISRARLVILAMVFHTGQCLPCLANCRVCSGQQQSICTQCGAGFYLNSQFGCSNLFLMDVRVVHRLDVRPVLPGIIYKYLMGYCLCSTL